MFLCMTGIILQRLDMPLVYGAVFVCPKSDARFLAGEPFVNVRLNLTIEN